MTFLNNVSRETRTNLETYVGLLLKWNRSINLIGKTTEEVVWSRHIEDSVQILEHAPTTFTNWVDLGSGGGFPGMVIAILLRENPAVDDVVLIESDQRKCAFLLEVCRKTNLHADVVNKRVEDVPSLQADVISARALASLPSLLKMTYQHRKPNGVSLFSKGASWEKEVKASQNAWQFGWKAHKSMTHPDSVILEIGKLNHV